MWLRVATDPDSVIKGEAYVWVTRKYFHYEEYFFDEDVADELEKDGFLLEMWNKFDALFDWGDADFFFPDKCERLIHWVDERFERPVPETIAPVYRVLKECSEKAVKYQTGIDFDF